MKKIILLLSFIISFFAGVLIARADTEWKCRASPIGKSGIINVFGYGSDKIETKKRTLSFCNKIFKNCNVDYCRQIKRK